MIGKKISTLCAIALMSIGSTAQACTRAVYLGPQNTVLTGRTMDWANPIHTDLWVFPRDIKRNGAAGSKSVEWTAKYGSIVASGFNAATVDGMNEKGLVANLLYLVESQYPKPGKDDKRKPLSIAAWAQYVLDNYASVAEAVAELRREPIYIVPVMTPDGKPGQGHLALSDASGDSAILEYLKGKLVIHQGREYQVMTNSPPYDQQLALNTYWQQIGGLVMLPGTNRAADRFVRASFYINAVTQTDDPLQSAAAVFSVMRNVSVPLGISVPGQPNIASTLWRTVANHKAKQYFFESTLQPNVFWVNMPELDFTAGKPIKKLDLQGSQLYAGNVVSQFQPSDPFVFLVAQPAS